MGAGAVSAKHERPTPDWLIDDGWTYVPYKFRQGTLSSGELPHASEVVERWPEGLSRVVVGINTMGFVEGPSEHRCPQHSLEFRTNLKFELLVRKAGGPEAAAKLLATQIRKKRGKAQSAASDCGAGADMCAAVGAAACSSRSEATRAAEAEEQRAEGDKIQRA